MGTKCYQRWRNFVPLGLGPNKVAIRGWWYRRPASVLVVTITIPTLPHSASAPSAATSSPDARELAGEADALGELGLG